MAVITNISSKKNDQKINSSKINYSASKIMQPFPLDIESVKKMGVRNWLNGPVWPIHDKELRALYRDVDHALIQVTNAGIPEFQDAMVVLFNKLGEHIVSYLYAEILKARLKESGLEPQFKPGLRHFHGLVSNEISMVGHYGVLEPLENLPGLTERLRARIKTLTNNVRYHSLGRVNWSFKSRSVLCFKYPDSEWEYYAQKQGWTLKIVHPRIFMPHPVKNLKSDHFAWLISELNQHLRTVAEKYGVDTELESWDLLENTICRSIEITSNYIKQVESKLKRFNKKFLMIDGLGNLFKRMICVAAKKCKIEVIGFTHGNSMGFSRIGNFAYVDMSIVDRYVVPTKASVRLFRKAFDHYPIVKSKRIQIEVHPKANRIQKVENNTKATFSKEIKSVLFVECPIEYTLNREIYFNWPNQLELILKTSDFLRKIGIRTVLKLHPDGLKHSQGVYDDFFDELITDRFENVYQKNDALFFPYICSTTFGFSLLSNKPIFFYESMLESVWEEVHEPLKKRCMVIPSFIDENGKLQFDEGQFRQYVMENPKEPDHEVVEKYMRNKEIKKIK